MTTIDETYEQTVLAVDHVISHVRAHDFDRSTPCDAWTVRHLLGHVVDGQEQVATMLGGGSPQPPAQTLSELASLGESFRTSWPRSRERTLLELRRQPDDAVVHTLGGPLSRTAFLVTALIEPLIHGWDLAVSIGTEIVLDPTAVSLLLDQVRPLGRQLAATGMYAEPTSLPDPASPAEELFALTGRAGRRPVPVGLDQQRGEANDAGR